MDIISWNVNWIRAVMKKGFKDFVENHSPDVLCLQETKAFENQFLKEVWDISWYKYVWHIWEKPGYAGTAVFFKNDLNPLNTKNHFWEEEKFHVEGRITEIEFQKFVIMNVYFPNWWTKADGTQMLDYKLNFYDRLIQYTNEIVRSWKNVVVTWDFNVAHTSIDIARPKQNKNSIWFLPEERKKLSKFLDNGYVDAFRYFYPEQENVYSWWSYRSWARQRNVWWRLDYFFVNNAFIKNIKDIVYMDEVYWSDHCPVLLRLK